MPRTQVAKSAPLTVLSYRRDNLRSYIRDNGGPLSVAKRLGYANASFLVQMTGPHPSRDVTEATARAYEHKLGLREGALDTPTEPRSAPVAPPPASRPMRRASDRPRAPDHFLAAMRLVCQEAEGYDVAQEKLQQIVRLVADDANASGGPRVAFARMLLGLAK